MNQRYLDPTNDVAFKKLFNNKERLIDLLNNILNLPQGSRIIDLTYIPVEQMPLFLDGKRSIFDLKVMDETDRWYIIEMQRRTNRDYINRVQFYGSYSYVNQLEAGIAHRDLLPVVVISILGNKIFPAELPCINYHSFKENNTNKQYLFSLTYVFIELGKFNENEIKTDTDQWLHLLKCAADEEEPPKEIDNSKVLSAYGDLEKYKWTKAEHDAYIRSMLAQEAEESAMDEKFAEGNAEGKTERNIEIAREMLLDNEPIDKIVKFSKLSKQEIETLRKN
jgi:predicted transposase/invertase (TIGR01784 family)